MKNIFFLISLILSDSNQLLCILDCQNTKIDISKPFQDPSTIYQCHNDTRATKCYGRIMFYYNEGNNQSFISYTFGSHDHIIEKEIEELAYRNNLQYIIYVLFLVESFDSKELVVTTYIICQTKDNCALYYVRELFTLYNEQKNPINRLSDLLYSHNRTSVLNCYEYLTGQTKKCLTYQYPTCIMKNTYLIEQGCHSDSITKLEYVYMITSLTKNFISKVLELVICNRNNCNEKTTLKEIENIVYNYTIKINMTSNHSNKPIFDLLHITFLFIFINIF